MLILIRKLVFILKEKVTQNRFFHIFCKYQLLLKKNFLISEIRRKITTNYSHYQVNKNYFSEMLLSADNQNNKFILNFYEKKDASI